MRKYLRDLPEKCEWRNKPLVGAFYHAKNGKFSREVLPTYGIAKKCYNDLSDAWTGSEEFYFEVSE